MTDLLRARLERREWTVTVEVVTPPPSDSSARARILDLADAVHGDDRVAALTLTDRTIARDGDPIVLAPAVAARSGKAPLVHLAGKGRDAADVTDALQHVGAVSVLLTGGDRLPGDAVSGRDSINALDMLRLARARDPQLLSLAVLAPGRARDEAWADAVAKRDAGAAAFIAQVSWDLVVRETIAGWQARLGVPVLGAVMPLTRGRLAFLARHRIGGIVVPPALRRRAGREGLDAALRRLAMDLVALRRLGYAGAHVSGLLTPALVAGALDEAEGRDRALGDDWRDVWREAIGIA